MSRSAWRIWAPVVLATLVFLPRALPTPVVDEPVEARAIELPQLHGVRGRARETTYELVPEQSSIRFLVAGTGGELLAECRRMEGQMRLGPDRTDGMLELDLDLSSLHALTELDSGPSTRDVLGVLRDVEVEVRSSLIAVATSDLPGLQQDTWDGTVRLGARVIRQPIQLWRCSLPGRLLRTQGHGTVAGVNFGLPSRDWFGLFEERYQVTLGLDLAWRRRRGN